jgi:hypothetical protein
MNATGHLIPRADLKRGPPYTAGLDKVYNLDNMPPVLLAPISDNLQNDSNLEPQFVRIRESTTADLYLDTAKGTYNGNATWSLSNMSMAFINKISPIAVRIFGQIPNINIRNNVFTFTTNGTNSFTAVIPEGFYGVTATAMGALLAALNAAGSGETFTTVVVSGSTLYNLNSTGLFSFTGGSGTFGGPGGYGEFGFGIPIGTPLADTLVIGAVSLFYTRYIDVDSRQLTQFSKLPPAGVNVRSSTLSRLGVPPLITAPAYYTELVDPVQWFSFNPSYSIQTVDLCLYDEFSQPLYIPSYVNNFAVEVKLLAQK